MISKYNSFIEDKLLESMINESFLYFSPPFRKILGKVFKQHHSDIAAEIITSEGEDVKPDMTFIDLGKEGYLSFITMKNAKPLVVAKYPNMDWAINIENKPLPDAKLYSNDFHDMDTNKDKDATGVFLKSRNEVGIGRFINKLFPGKYNSKQIEEFINQFKAALEKSGEHFDLVEAEDIEHWYSYENYKEMSGTLGNSCMAKKSDLFDIYMQNQDACKMLILLEDDKLIGRALIWKLNSVKTGRKDFEGAPEYFMDRQYTIKESDVQKFRNYAKAQGWAYKSYNNHHSFTTLTINGEEKNLNLTVKVAAKRYNRYPYMDTFRRYNPETGILYNDDENSADYEGCYLLDDTGGGYTEIEGGVYSEWHDRTIPEDEAVYSDYLDTYILRDYAVEVTRGSRRYRGWYPEDHDNVTRAYDGHYYHYEDTVYSSVYNETIYHDDAVLVITDIYPDGDIDSPDDTYMSDTDSDIVFEREYSKLLWYEFLSDKFSDWNDYSGVNKELLVKNWEDSWIPKMFAIEVYKVLEPKDDSADMMGTEYLTEIDSEILGWNIDKSDNRIIDQFQYHKDIDHLLEDVKTRANNLSQSYKDILNGKGQQRLKFSEEQEKAYLEKIQKNLNKLRLRIEDIETEKFFEL